MNWHAFCKNKVMKRLFLILLTIISLKATSQCTLTVTASYAQTSCPTCCDGVITGTLNGVVTCGPTTTPQLLPGYIPSPTMTWTNLCAGNYTINLLTGCCQITCGVAIPSWPTGIFDSNNSLSTKVNIYPNPVSSILNIESEKYFEPGTQIEITNTLGQTVLKLQHKNEIDVSQLSKGYYILKMINPENQQFNSRFIKD